MFSFIDLYSPVSGNKLGKILLVVLAGALQSCASGYKQPQAISNSLRTPEVAPMELNRFSVAPAAKAVELQWETVAELGCAYFIVERSPDNISFTAIGQVPGDDMAIAPTTHEFTDRQPLASMTYYRLRQVDLNGVVHAGPTRTYDAQPGVSWKQLARF
ncbi:hypothetical protein [Hymenobacter glacieicola]|uniref:Fibronectin type-III domain-containing protein n=1 Tax=Hymenobacter glacieicola TaxID=1562124 RepID=A0ABQ1X8D2_9BACT|nr:hypothetical protein [Hymenobacter glacieicola]GGG59034.1 hypothetical protein GCM10011378_38830 [Hymenobacter glacieicola]